MSEQVDIVIEPGTESPTVLSEPIKKKRGRPKGVTKAVIAERVEARKVGRPRHTNDRLVEFKQRLLGTTGSTIIEKLIQIAQDDNHDGQMAAMKMCIERILPLSSFQEKGEGKPMVQVTIVNATEEKTVTVDLPPEDEITDA